VVQSWLASWIYARVDDLAGGDGLRVLMAALSVSLFVAIWRLSAPAEGLLARGAIGGLSVCIGATVWSQRPLLFGLLCCALLVLATEERLDARWLLPIGWVWVNTHGSFPLGIAFLLVAYVGARLDRAVSSSEGRCARWFAAGIVLGSLNPLGPRLLLFPVELLQRQDMLREVTEWQSPGFVSTGDRLFLLAVLASLVALVRRPSYRDGLLVGVFLVAALLGARNIAVASIVFVPVLARGAGSLGSLRSGARPVMARAVCLVAGGLLVVVTVGSLGRPPYDLTSFPLQMIEYLDDHGVDLQHTHMATNERTGNLIDLHYGSRGATFFDDRFDMFPEPVFRDALALTRGGPKWSEALDRYEVDLVLWPSRGPLSQLLSLDPSWRTLRVDDGYLLSCRRGAEVAGSDLHC
jgi:hypothetical protein